MTYRKHGTKNLPKNMKREFLLKVPQSVDVQSPTRSLENLEIQENKKN